MIHGATKNKTLITVTGFPPDLGKLNNTRRSEVLAGTLENKMQKMGRIFCRHTANVLY